MAYQSGYASGPSSPAYAEPYSQPVYQPYSEGRSDYPTPDVRRGRQDPLDRYAQGAAQRAGINGQAARQGDPARVRAKIPRNDHPGSHERPYDAWSQRHGNPQYPRKNEDPQCSQSHANMGFNSVPHPARDQYIGQAMAWQEHKHGSETPHEYRPPLTGEAVSRTHPYHTQLPVRTVQAERHVTRQETSQPMAYKHDPQPGQERHKSRPGPPSAGSSASSPHGRSNASATSRPGTASRQRIFDNISPPDTVSWDNPFPSFPAARKRKEQITPRNELADPIGKFSVVTDLNSHQAQVSRPQTASSKGSYGASINDSKDATEKEVFVGDSDPRLGPFSPPGAVPPSSPNPGTKLATHQNAFEDCRAVDHRQEPMALFQETGLRSPPPATRHSEELDRAPKKKHNFPPVSDAQRSRTMPSAVGRSEPEYRNLPVSPVSPIWQEQGPTAGYYGPIDKAFLSSTEDDGPSPGIRTAPTASPEQDPPAGTRSRPSLITEDSFTDVYDSDSQPPDHGHHSAQHRFDRSGQVRAREHMPNPADQDLKQAAHRRGLTIDKHLELGLDAGPAPSMPKPYRMHGDQATQAKDPRRNYMPRSRSQPDLKDRRPPAGSENSLFDFQLPQAPPATAPAPLSDHGRMYGPSGSHAPRSHIQHALADTPMRSGNVPPPMNGQYNGVQRSREPPYSRSMTQPRSDGYQHPPGTDHIDPNFHPSNGPGDRSGPMTPPPSGGRDLDNSRSSAISNSCTKRGPTSPPPVISTDYGNHHTNSRRNPGNIKGPTSLPPDPATNPNALPAHPAPMRSEHGPEQGVRPPPNRGPDMGSYKTHPNTGQNVSRPPPVRNYNNALRPAPGQLGQNARPPPVRNYQYDAPSGPVADGSAAGKAPRLDQKRESSPITSQELQRRRQAATVNPGNLEAQFLFGKGLAEAANVLVEYVDTKNKGRERDRYNSEALRIMKKLASEQCSEAMFFLGDCYSQGRLGLAMDAKEAFMLYQSAAKAGHAASAFRVAVCCEMGLEEGGGTKRDLQKAIQWYTRAATLGDTPAMYKVGIIQLKGLLSQPTNPTEALVWLGKAAQRADAENPHALHELVCACPSYLFIGALITAYI